MISASIVLYQPDLDTLKKTIVSFLSTPLPKKLFLIDHSRTRTEHPLFEEKEVEYIFVGKNLGFAKGHNRVLSQLQSDDHLILNPDVQFSSDVIPTLIEKYQTEKGIACIAPKVRYPDGALQYICRRYPSVFDLMNRRLLLSKKRRDQHEYRNVDLDAPFYPDWIHGCFLLFKTADFKAIGGFDERYFLYMEDVDICKKIDQLGKQKYYFPKVEIIHHHQRGSTKKGNLFFIHLHSALRYFLKWGF